jgi:ATP-binding cassette subfamily B protein
MMLSHIFTMFVRARTSAERIGEVLAIPTQNAGAAAPTAEASRARGERAPGWSIDYRSVSLRYEEAASPALRDIGFACPAGSMMGIIGSTGSGKTSLVRLMPRFYRPTEGAVLIGGRDITEWDLRALRDGIALVPQKSILFTGTIEENLRWGKADAELEELDRATEAAAAGEFIAALPKGYGTQIGRGGLTLSGGQRQRLAIARALVRRPSVLILDDSLSAVDGVTENLIRTGLRRACPGATIVIIAQRIASVRDLDTILVLDEGAAVGLGTHEELLASCPVYQDIRRSQVGIEEATHG